MGAVKTRCKECLYSSNKATEEPCNKCGEISFTHLKYENHFVPANKNLMGVQNE